MNKKKIIIALIALVVLIGAFVGIYLGTREDTKAGDKNIAVAISYDDVEKTVNINTDAEYLRGALEEKEGLVKGSDSEFGLFITEVDGRTADSVKQEWWCITKSGESLSTGADSIVIEDGDSFELTLKTGW